MFLAQAGRILTYAILVSAMVLVMRQSGCCGPVYLPKEDIGQRADGRCSYLPCDQPATGTRVAKVYSHMKHEASQDVTYYDAQELPLCDQHARCARMERWPESGPVETWFHAIVTGGFLGALMAGTLNVFLFSPRNSPVRAPAPRSAVAAST